MRALEITKHKTILTNILFDLYRDDILSKLLIFKGGTAAMLFFNLPRFSTDLDFDITDNTKLKEIQTRVNNIVKDKYNVKDKSFKKNTLFWRLSYEKGFSNIKIEISTRQNKYNTYTPQSFYGFIINVLDIPSMIAHKMVAATERNTNRDLFDIHYFLSSKYAIDINYDAITERTKQKPITFYKTLLKRVEQTKNNQILGGLGEVLDEKQKDFVRTKLKKELQTLIKRQIGLFPKTISFEKIEVVERTVGDYKQFNFQYLINKNFRISFPLKISETLFATENISIKELEKIFSPKIIEIIEISPIQEFNTRVITTYDVDIKKLNIKDFIIKSI